MFYDPGIAVVSGVDADLVEIELIEAEQVEGKYAQEVVPAKAEKVERESSVPELGLETDCAELGSVGDAQTVATQVHPMYHWRGMLAETPDQSRRVVGWLGMVHS
jgi:hypothetical protein